MSVLTLLCAAPLSAEPRRPRPNIVFIMSDDMGYETVGFNGAVNYRTPHIDALAREAIVFTQCDAMPLCCPTRTRVVTGQYNYRNYAGWDGRYIRTAPTVAEVLRAAGYATGAYGKWHLGRNNAPELGFEDSCLLDLAMDQKTLMQHAYYRAPYLRNGKSVEADYGPDYAAECALQFIAANKDRPFFLYYTPWLSHNPFVPTPDSKDPASGDWQQNFEDMVEYCDKLIGRVIAKLKACGVYDNTVIVYTGDNGTKTCRHRMQDGSVVYGQKGTHTVDGCRVPLVVRTDGSHRTLENLIDFADFYPTFADLAGIPPETLDDTIDGVSFATLLRGGEGELRPFLFSMYEGSVYVRTARFKYYIDRRLYDIESDPRELRPFHTESDTPETARARSQLSSFLDQVLQDPRLAEAHHRKRVEALRQRHEGPSSRWLLGARQFDGIPPDGMRVKMTFDVTPFISRAGSDYAVTFSRACGTRNSGLIYSDARVTACELVGDGQSLAAVHPPDLRLTTRYKDEVVNPLVDFVYDESNNRVELGRIHPPEGGQRIELAIEAVLSNPGNQWGDRIQLFTELERTPA